MAPEADDDSVGRDRLRRYNFFGVADGVGSWRQWGVDPKLFSHRLMHHCADLVREAGRACADDADPDAVSPGASKILQTPISRVPATVLELAHARVIEENVVGSCTANVAVFDGMRQQVHFANLGDSGIIVLRHIDSDVAGALKRDTTTPRPLRQSDLRVTFVSAQQLRSFNHPFQLGWTGREVAWSEDDETSFRRASESCCSSVQVRRGDVVLLATDGLFDNVEIDDIVDIVLEWEERHGFVEDGNATGRTDRWLRGNSKRAESLRAVPELAQQLCQRARENSLDGAKDSPFAILAKENDIMWSGGMPDDCTVIAMHIVGSSSQ
uniref:Protein phosphatase n=1 Tax=Corethron hystrix TaxID=216773 RepID=A0A7S1FV43_9STRA